MASSSNSTRGGSGGDEGSAAMTLRRAFDELVTVYTRDIVDGGAGDMTAQQALLRRVAPRLEALWRSIETAGVFSSNEELDDYTTTALEMLWVPYVVADVYERMQDSAPSIDDGISNSSGSSGSGDKNGKSSSSTAAHAARERDAQVLSRQDALTRSQHWYTVFFARMQDAGLLDEKDVERYAHYRSEQRTQRIELARRCRELREQWQQAQQAVAYMRARRARHRRLTSATTSSHANNDSSKDDGADDDGGEDEECVRACALARLRWSTLEACHQLQLSQREAELLGALSPEQRAAASQAYQARIDAVRRGTASLGRQTYTILPGGAMVVGTLQQPLPVRAEAVAASGGARAVDVATAAPPPPLSSSNAALAALQYNTSSPQPPLPSCSSASAALSSSAHEPLRQQIRRTLMVDRNPPTMSLQAFAEKEMAAARRQADAEAAAAQQQAEEDARIGREGVEERQRHKDSAWADWRDAHPAFGPTSKGNFA